MKRRMWFFILLSLTLQVIINWVSVSSRPLHPYVQQGKVEILQKAGFEEEYNMSMGMSSSSSRRRRAVSRIGSIPPNCEHKCRGCFPCYATQTPATVDQLALQYTNYKPEGWKCKCGSSFYNP